MYRDRPLLEVLSWVAAIASVVLTLYLSFEPPEKSPKSISPLPIATNNTAEPVDTSTQLRRHDLPLRESEKPTAAISLPAPNSTASPSSQDQSLMQPEQFEDNSPVDSSTITTESSITLPEPVSDSQLPVSVAPSFQCAKATYSTEKLICRSPELAVLDLTLANAYRDAVASLASKSDKTALRDQQNYWLRHIRDRCTETLCLRHVYELRIAELRAAGRELPSNLVP